MRYSLFILLFVFKLAVSQTTSSNGYTFSSVFNTNQSHSYQACKRINLKPGFSYSPSSQSNITSLKVDPNLNCAVDYTAPNTYNPANLLPNILNTNDEVGKIDYNYTVDQNGSFMVNIPILISPGTQGMQPNLSLTYNSMATEGILGMGWNLSGLSRIVKGGRNYFQSGATSQMTGGFNDPYYLDGQIIYPLNGLNGGNNTIYGTEAETYVQIKSFYNMGVSSFQVKGKDGSLMEYGTSPDSKFSVAGIEVAWLLKKVTDRNGNYWEVTYKNFGENEVLPDYITYTGNTAQALVPYNKIKFTYNEKNNLSRGYLLNTLNKDSKLLTQIEVEAEGQFVRSYEFIYSQPADAKTNLLNEVIEWNENNKKFNSFKCYYNFNFPSGTQANVNSQIFESSIAEKTFADVNGDGFTDIITLESVPNLFNQISLSIKVFLNGGDGGFPSVSTQTIINIPNGFSLAPKTWFGKYNMLFSDFNNDSFEDFALVIRPNPANNLIGYIIPFVSTGSGFVQKQATNISFSNVFDYTTGDFDGDGYIEYAFANNRNVEIMKFNQTSQKFESIYNFQFSVDPPDYVKNLSPIQLTNDQKQELFFTQNSGSRYFTFLTSYNNGTVNIVSHTFINKPFPTSNQNCYIADYNGDGLTDIITQQTVAVTASANQTIPVPNEWKIAYGKGTSNYDFEVVNITSGLHQNSELNAFGFVNPINNNVNSINIPNNYISNYFVADVNNDGVSEFVQSRFELAIETNQASSNFNKITTLTNATVQAFSLKNPPSATNPQEWMNFTLDINTGGHIFISPVADFDGDGFPDALMDRLTIATTPTNVTKRFFKFPIPSRYINLIADGFGRTTRVNYNTLSKMGTALYLAYFPNDPYITQNTHPDVINFTPRFNVVSSLIEDIGSNVYQEINYIYQGAKIHLKGKGFLGFSAIRKTNTNTKYREFEIYSDPVTNPYFIRLPLEKQIAVEVAPFNFQTILSNTFTNVFDNQFLYGNFQNRRYSVYTASTTSIDHLNGQVTKVSSIIRDNYGNVTQQKTLIYPSNNVFLPPVEEEIIDNAYAADLMFDANIPSRITSITQTRKHATKPNYIRNTQLNYQPNAPGMLSTTLDVEKNLTTNYTYDGFGNVTQTSVSGNSIGNNYATEQMVYDSKGRFLLEKTNPLGHKMQYTVEPKYGNVLAEKDANNLLNSYTYDGFGRVKTKTNALGITTDVSWHWSNSSPVNTLYYSKTYKPGTGESDVYYDRLGRAIVKQTDVYNNQVRSFRTSYNNRGLVDSEIDENLNQSTFYQYDAFARPTVINSPSGASTQITYGTLTKTTTVSQGSITQVHKETYHASGKLLQKVDQDGTILYEYGSHGQPEKISLGNQTITMQYDNTGRQIVLNDAAAGIMQYTFDELDRLLTQTDAKNQTTSNTYDLLGRVVQKTIPEGVINYQYDIGQGALGQLSKITNYNGQECEYQYDQLSRLIAKKEKNLLTTGDEFNFTYFYDNLGRIAAQKYPNNITLNYTYDQLGYLQKTMFGQSTLFNLQNLNIRDQLTKADFGNGITLNNAYDAFGLPVSNSYTHTNSSFNTLYTYNIQSSNGNLSSRSVLHSSPTIFNTENFNYDNSHRLTSFAPVGNPTVNMQYDNYGNMTYKTDLGQLNYAANQPNALSSVNTSTGTFPSATQDIHFTSFQQPDTISEGNYKAILTYGCDMQRKAMTIEQNNQPYKQFLYLGDYEKLAIGTNTYELVYVSGYEGLIGILVSQNNNPAQMYYTQTDHLGSIVQLNDASGQLVYRVNFDPWGREREPIAMTYSNATNNKPEWLIRGYTGHEHIREFGLINMNGRLYDPLVGRMLSPDNYVQNATGVNAFNRYSYVYNNPLKFTDPSGEYVFSAIIGPVGAIIDGALWGATINLAIQTGAIVLGKQTEYNWAAVGGAALAGAVSAVFTLAAPAFGEIGNLAIRYTAKAAYAGLSVGSAAVANKYGTDRLDNGQIDNSGLDYAKTFGVGFAIGFGVSAVFSAYDYVNWDRLDTDGKIAKLNKKGYTVLKGESHIDPKTGKPVYGYSENNSVYMTKEGLDAQNFSEVKSMYKHEMRHIEFNSTKNAKLVQANYGKPAVKALSETEAYKLQLQKTRYNLSADYRNYLNSNLKYYTYEAKSYGLNLSQYQEGSNFWSYLLNLR